MTKLFMCSCCEKICDHCIPAKTQQIKWCKPEFTVYARDKMVQGFKTLLCEEVNCSKTCISSYSFIQEAFENLSFNCSRLMDS